MTAISKHTAAMGINLQKSTLRKTAFKMCNLISLAHIFVYDVKQEMRGDKRVSQLTQLQLASKTTYDVLQDATPRLLDALGVEATVKLMNNVALCNSDTNSAMEAAFSNDGNKLINPSPAR